MPYLAAWLLGTMAVSRSDDVMGRLAIAFLALAIGIAIGFMAHTLVKTEPTTAVHWRIVREYRAHVLDPANYQKDPHTGLSATTPPSDPMPSLAALVSAGELNRIDIVLPTVPANREVNRLWMDRCSKHDGIIHAEGNPTYVAFPTAGQQPLHLNIWFTPSAELDVKQLLADLEALGTGSKPEDK